MRTVSILLPAVLLASAACAPYGGGAKLGEDAPAMTLQDIDGQTVDLADHIGSEVVVLDFWASWCGPCRQALPHVEAVAEEYEGEPVTFFAVNQGEDKDTVAQFLAETGMDLNVLMDTDQSLGEAYGVRGIPHIAVVGPGGTVQAEFVGFSGQTAQQLRNRIDAGLADLKAGDGEEPAPS